MVTLQKGSEPVPGYILAEKLGAGSFGVVWSAVAPGETRVALKFLDLQLAGGQKEFEAISAIKNIRHPNLLPIIGVWQLDANGDVIRRNGSGRFRLGSVTPAMLVIAMVAGEKSLDDVLIESKEAGHAGVPAEELLEYIEDAARGIDFLNSPRHDLGDGRLVSIQHRDIKPDNILLVGDAAVLCDFGVARACREESVRSTGMIGSPAFISPESISGSDVGGASDQYSLALTYYYLRTGCHAVHAASQATAISSHLAGELDFNRVGEAERAVLRRATSINTSARFESCREMTRALRVAASFIPPIGFDPATEWNADVVATAIDPRFESTTAAGARDGDSATASAPETQHRLGKTGVWKRRMPNQGRSVRVALLAIATVALSLVGNGFTSGTRGTTAVEQVDATSGVVDEGRPEIGDSEPVETFAISQPDVEPEREEFGSESRQGEQAVLEQHAALQQNTALQEDTPDAVPTFVAVAEPIIPARPIPPVLDQIAEADVTSDRALEDTRDLGEAVSEPSGKEKALAMLDRLGGSLSADETELDLSGTEITFDDLSHLEHLPNLRSLSLERTDTDDESLMEIIGFQSGLESLFLSETKISDRGVRLIAKLGDLSRLDLSGCEISDSALAHLHSLENLKAVGLSGTSVTDRTLYELSEALAHDAVIQGPKFNLLGGKRFDVKF